MKLHRRGYSKLKKAFWLHVAINSSMIRVRWGNMVHGKVRCGEDDNIRTKICTPRWGCLRNHISMDAWFCRTSKWWNQCRVHASHASVSWHSFLDWNERYENLNNKKKRSEKFTGAFVSLLIVRVAQSGIVLKCSIKCFFMQKLYYLQYIFWR